MKKTTFLIAGKHAVTEALKNPNRKVLNVLLTEDSKKKLNKDNNNLNLLFLTYYLKIFCEVVMFDSQFLLILF